MALIEDILQDLDEAVLDVGEKYFTSTADALDPMLTIVTTLLIVLIGVTMALGVNRMSMRDAWQLVSRIVLVFIFARSWTNFGVIYDALSSGAGSLALSFFQGDTPNPAAAMDQFAVQMSDVTDGAARAVGSIMRGLVSAALFIILSILMAAYVLIVGFSKIMIAFLLGVAPLAMIATIFERTKTMFEAWLTAFVGYRLVWRRKAPVLDRTFDIPKNRAIDKPLLVGAALFGIGWGIGGFCPGPAFTALPLLAPGTLIFLPAMLVGLWLGARIKAGSSLQGKGATS